MKKIKAEINTPFKVTIKGKTMFLVAKAYKDSSHSSCPCVECDLGSSMLLEKNFQRSPVNCHKIVPSCFAHAREDKTSVIYKIVKF